MAKYAPSTWSFENSSVSDAASLAIPQMRGFLESMKYYGCEDKALAQLRWVHFGSHQVIAAHYADLAQLFGKEDPVELTTALMGAKTETVNISKELLYEVKQPPQSVLYIPACMVIADRTLNSTRAVGMKMPVCTPGRLQHLEKYHQERSKTDKMPNVLRKAAVEYMRYLKTGGVAADRVAEPALDDALPAVAPTGG